jgi:hypothetical protein
MDGWLAMGSRKKAAAVKKNWSFLSRPHKT